MFMKKDCGFFAALGLAIAMSACGRSDVSVGKMVSESRSLTLAESVGDGFIAAADSAAGTKSFGADSALNEKTDSSESFSSGKEENKAKSEVPYLKDPEAEDSPGWLQSIPEARDENVKQLFVVSCDGVRQTTACVTMHERDAGGAWKQVLSAPAYVGRNGLCEDADHWEGCGQTPMGTYRFNKAFGIAEDPGCAIPYVKVNGDVYWSGDMREGMHYNEMVDIREYPDLDLTFSEHIVEATNGYRYCLNISFNEEGVPGRGSAIFLHCFIPGKASTGGCVAVSEENMKRILQRVSPECVVVIDTKEDLEIVE